MSESTRLLRKKAYQFIWRRLRTRSVNESDLQNVLQGDSSLLILPFKAGSDPSPPS